MASIQYKKQNCGKVNCSECREKRYHEGYWFLVIYLSKKVMSEWAELIKKRIEKKVGDYVWVYLGRGIDNVKQELRDIDPKLLKIPHIINKLNNFYIE
jgi:hypothetical protein